MDTAFIGCAVEGVPLAALLTLDTSPGAGAWGCSRTLQVL